MDDPTLLSMTRKFLEGWGPWSPTLDKDVKGGAPGLHTSTTSGSSPGHFLGAVPGARFRTGADAR